MTTNTKPDIGEREPTIICRARQLRSTAHDRLAADHGQTTAEYGLVLLAAATIAMLVVAWAGGTDAIGGFFDEIMSKITSLIA